MVLKAMQYFSIQFRESVDVFFFRNSSTIGFSPQPDCLPAALPACFKAKAFQAEEHFIWPQNPNDACGQKRSTKGGEGEKEGKKSKAYLIIVEKKRDERKRLIAITSPLLHFVKRRKLLCNVLWVK